MAEGSVEVLDEGGKGGVAAVEVVERVREEMRGDVRVGRGGVECEGELGICLCFPRRPDREEDLDVDDLGEEEREVDVGAPPSREGVD